MGERPPSPKCFEAAEAARIIDAEFGSRELLAALIRYFKRGGRG